MPISSGYSAQDLSRMGPDPLTRKRMLAEALLGGAMKPRKIEHPLEGAAQIAQSLMGGLQMRKLDKAEAAGRDSASAQFNELGAALAGPAAFPSAPGTDAKPMSPSMANPDDPRVGSTIDFARAEQGGNPGYRDAIASIESGGKYDAIGPTHPKMGRALGKYQVMEANLPEWTRQVLGHEVDAETFLRSPQIQDAVFDTIFGGYVDQFGPEGAAQAWFGGPGGVGKVGRKDSLGTSIGEYGNRFTQALGTQVAGGGQEAIANALMRGEQPDPAATLGARPIPQGGPDLQMLMQAAGNQWMNPQQSGIIEALIGQKLAPPKPKQFGFQSGRDGAIFRTDPETGSIEQVYGGKPDTFRVLSNDEEVQMGLDPAGSYQIGADNKVSKIGGEGTTVNIDQKTEGQFDKTLATKDAELYSAMSEEGMNAKADLGVIDELETLLQGQGGAMTGISGMLAQKGIGGEGMSDLQAAQALINKLVPTMRQPGSGTMSDRDVELFTRSLPSLWNTPQGNQKIMRVMRGLAEYRHAQGDIASRVITGELGRQEARQMLRELPNPLAGLDKPKVKDAPVTRTPVVIDGYTIEEID